MSEHGLKGDREEKKRRERGMKRMAGGERMRGKDNRNKKLDGKC